MSAMHSRTMNTSMSMSFSQQPGNISFNNSSIGMSLNRTKCGRGEGTILTSQGTTHIVEPFGVPLPAMVRSALNSSAETQSHHLQVSCRLDQNGWAWLVSGRGRRLYVWRHSPDAACKKGGIACRELILPPSELVHNAQLVTVVCSGSTTSVIAVSPEGHITFWPNLSNESSTITFNADVPGQECDTLTSLWPLGCILTTTSGTTLLIKSVLGRGNKASLTCVSLGVQKSWLGGLSKKVSTMLFTTMPSASSGLDSKRVKILVPLSKEDDPSKPGNNKEGKIYILQGPVIQTWIISPDSTLICKEEVSLDDNLRKEFFDNVWGVDNDDMRGDIRGIQTWSLDGTYNSNTKQIAVFAAARNQYETADNLVYGLVLFETKCMRRRDEWQFIPVSSDVGAAGNEDQLPAWKLFATANNYYVVSHSAVLTASEKSDPPADVFDSKLLGGPVVGAGLVSPQTLTILVPKHGLLIVKPFNAPETRFLDETFSEIRVPDHLAFSLAQSSVLDESTNEESLTKYKSAFLLFLQKKQDNCQDLIQGLFPSNIPNMAPDDPLDKSTVALCEKLMDEAPVADPRWAATFGRNDEQDPLGMKSKILIKNFLNDKKEGLELFFGFLSNSGISAKLQGVVVKEDVVSTKSLLYNCYEKVCLALVLQNMQADSQFRKQIDSAVKSIVLLRSQKDVQVRKSNLNANDVFYKDVSRVHEIIPALVSIEEDIFGDLLSKEVAEKILQTNEIILRAKLEIMEPPINDKLSQLHDLLIRPVLLTDENQYEILPWMIQSTVLKALLKQHEITTMSGIQNVDVEAGVKVDLIKQLQQLTDLILSEFKLNLESIGSTQRYEQKLKKFESTRSALLRRHLQVGDYDGAKLLAEKYVDFEILVTICYNKKNFEGLELLFEKYENMKFPEFSFDWYIKQAKTAELVETFSRSKFRNKLKQYLRQCPQVAWHYAAITEDHEEATNTLIKLSEHDTSYVEDKEFYLCLAKLASLANSDPQETVTTSLNCSDLIRHLDQNLDLLEFQTSVPDDVLASVGLERSTMRVLSPDDLINLYTTDDVEFDVQNYWKAFRLSSYMPNVEIEKEKRTLVLARVIGRDAWDWETDHPMDVIENTGLYLFIATALQQGVPLDEAYPLEELAKFDQMQNLMNNPTTKYLLKACHEHFNAAIASQMET